MEKRALAPPGAKCARKEGEGSMKKSTGMSVARKVLCSALSAAMVVAFAPAVATAVGSNDGTAYAAEGDEPTDEAPSEVSVDGEMTLQQALDSVAEGGTVTLKKDIELKPSDNASSAAIPIVKDVTIDLSGHSIKGVDTRVFHVEKGTLDLAGKGTVSASGTEGNSQFPNNSSVIRVGSNNNVDEDAHTDLVVGKDVTVSTDYCWGISVFGSKTTESLDVYGKIITTGHQGCISGNGGANYGDTTIWLNDGAELYSKDQLAIYHPQKGWLYLQSAKVTGSAGIEMKAGTLSVAVNSNPVVTATGEKKHNPNGDGNSTDGYALSVVGNSGYAGPASAYLTNGTFVGGITIADDNKPAAQHGFIEVSGGTYSENPSAFLPITDTGDYKVTQSNGKYSVSLNSTKAVQLLDANGASHLYSELAEAVAAVGNNSDGTIKLLKDMKIDDGATIAIPSNKEVYIDLNGKKITGNATGGNGTAASGGLFCVDERGYLDIEGSGSIVNTATGRAPVFSVAGGLYVNGGSYSTDGYALIDDFGDVTIDNGSFQSNYKNALDEASAIYVVGDANLNFAKGSLDASAGTYGIYVKEARADAEVNLGDWNDIGPGPSIKSYWAAIAGNNKAAPCNFYIYGGTYTAGHASSKDVADDKENSILFLPAQGEVNISAGTFMAAAKNTAVISLPYRDAGTKLRVNGGVFDASAGNAIIRTYKDDASYIHAPDGKTNNVVVRGGTFKGKITNFIGNNKYEGFITGGSFSAKPDVALLGDGLTSQLIGGMHTVSSSTHKHKWTSVVTRSASCTTSGMRTITCTGDETDTDSHGCGAVKTESIPALGHSYSATWSWNGVSSATATLKCGRCSSTTTLSASISKTQVTKPTCMAKGTNRYTATVANPSGTGTFSDSKTAQDEPALGHAYGPYTVTVQPTTALTGIATAKCTRTGCGSTVTKTIEKLESEQVTSIGGVSATATISDAKPATTPNGTNVVGSVVIDKVNAASNATKLEIPEVVTIKGTEYAVAGIDAKAIAGNAKLESVKLPDTIKEIPTGLFEGCSSLKEAKLPSKITQIPADTFNGTALASITIPTTVTKIGDRAFKNTDLKVVELPDSVKSLGKDAFKGCDMLDRGYGFKVLRSGVSRGAFDGCRSLKAIGQKKLIPGLSVKSLANEGSDIVDVSQAPFIGANAFRNCKSVTTIDVSGAKTIGAGAFKGASKLVSLKTGSKLKGIGSSALSGAKKVKTLNVKSKKLTKSGVKNALKGSSVKTVKVNVSGSKATKAKYIAKYKKIFTAKNCGKKVVVK